MTIGQKETLWNLPVAQEIFGQLEPPTKISATRSSKLAGEFWGQRGRRKKRVVSVFEDLHV